MPTTDTVLRRATRLRNSVNGNARFAISTDHGYWNTETDSAVADHVKVLAGNHGSDGDLDIPVTVTTERGFVTAIVRRELTPRLWAIQAEVSVTLETTGWTGSRQVPTFYLDPAVQGITDSDHPERIAEEILSTAGPINAESVFLHVHAEPLY